MKPESSAPVVRCLALLFHHILQEGRKKLINNHRIRDVRQANFQYITCQQNQGNNGIQTYFSHGNCLLTCCTSVIKQLFRQRYRVKELVLPQSILLYIIVKMNTRSCYNLNRTRAAGKLLKIISWQKPFVSWFLGFQKVPAYT